MFKIILIATTLFFSKSSSVESIYDISIKDIEGNNKTLSSYQGKKMLIITLPTQQNSYNNSLLHSLDSLGTLYANSLVIIASPCFEDGYDEHLNDALKQWYKSILGTGIIVTEGLYSRKTSGTSQAPLYQWLTYKDRNGHFDQDVMDPGSKFIVWTDGELTAVLGSQSKIRSSLMTTILTAQ